MGRKAGSEGKGFVTRIHPAYPNRTQERELLRQLDVARGVYNHFAETCIHCLIDGSHVPDPTVMNKEFTRMRALPAQVCEQLHPPGDHIQGVAVGGKV